MMSGSPRTLGATLLLFLSLFYLNRGSAQEDQVTPSQKAKEAIQKFGKTPELVGESLEALKKAGKAKLEETFGAKPVSKAEPEEIPLPVKKPDETDRPRYSPLGKRDPFQPLANKPRAGSLSQESLSPLTKYRLVGIVSNAKSQRALVEDSNGLGHSLAIGSIVGPNQAKVIRIKPTEVLIEEAYVDSRGKKKKREVVCSLETPSCMEGKASEMSR